MFLTVLCFDHLHHKLKLCACAQDLDSDMKDKYTRVEELIGQKAGGVAEAKKKAESLQKEAKKLLLQASGKLQLLKGDVTLPVYSVSSADQRSFIYKLEQQR